MALISTDEFKGKLLDFLNKGLITEEQYEDYIYQCAYTQAYEPNQLQEVMSYILCKTPSKLSEVEE